jgi:hypothetical protein
VLEPGRDEWILHRNLGSNVSTLEVISNDGVFRLDDIYLKFEFRSRERYSYRGDDFNSARGETHWVRGFVRDKWSVKTQTFTVLTSTTTDFHLHGWLDACEDGRRVYSNN